LTINCTNRKNGPLAVTDANLLLGRLIVDYFPKIFGKSEKEPLDIEASRVKFKEIAETVNAEGDFEKELSLDEVVYGFIKIANETMCRPIRALTEARGYATSSHMWVPQTHDRVEPLLILSYFLFLVTDSQVLVGLAGSTHARSRTSLEYRLC